MRLTEALRPYGRIALDTNICVYFLQQEPTRFALVSELMMLFGQRVELCLPDIVRLELLIHPYRTGDFDEMASVRGLLERGSPVEMNDDVVEVAAQLRAMTRLRTPDALVAACAAVDGCGAIVGNDAAFKDLQAMEGMTLFAAAKSATIPQYIHLDDYVDDV